MTGWRKWLFALLFLTGGLILGMQIGTWTGAKKSPVSHKAPARHAVVSAPKRAAAPKTVPTAQVPQDAPASYVPALPVTNPLKKTSVPEERPIVSSAPKVAIVLDDWGYNTQALATALSIHEPLTLAILPHLTYSTVVAEKGHAAGHEIMLHMPMEPLTKVQLEKGTIMSGMDATQVRSLLDAAMDSVPYIRGVNNHMGSKVTQDARILRIVMNDVQSRGLFFLNSMVTGSTVGREVAGDLGIAYAERDVFLDNTRTEEAILKELDNLRIAAIRQGSAVGIGHDEPVTLRAIQKVLPSWRAQGIEIVKLSDLIRLHSEGD